MLVKACTKLSQAGLSGRKWMGKAPSSPGVFKAVLTIQTKGAINSTTRASIRIYLPVAESVRLPPLTARCSAPPRLSFIDCCILYTSCALIVAVDFIIDPERAGTEDEESDAQDNQEEDPEQRRSIAETLVSEKLQVDIDQIEQIAA